MNKWEEVLNRVDADAPRVNVGINQTHHKYLKMVAAQQGYSVQRVMDFVLQRVLIEIEDVRIGDFQEWVESLNPEKYEPKERRDPNSSGASMRKTA
jgi:hypothetical protein